ncbi:hypothetical protein [Rugosimonospora africana]|uniref:Uncharacterized protein n=1 Tax=Rugosimonospora africana TaxID=556532 RepID=A0A8J3QQ96_9ACTN|nr:hypothetical protein [Rugosimonospora africana]GIH14958.1 hypothetical protein Raf01_31300 [Rugosimonospora africana]
MLEDGLAGGSRPFASRLEVPLTADRIASPRLMYGALDLLSAGGRGQAYTAVYFEDAASDALGRVTFEGLDAVRASRGEYLPVDYADADYRSGDWVYVVGGSPWLRERHDYETRHYATPLVETHRHYVFVFHDEFIEAIAKGIWLDVADRADPCGPPIGHPLSSFPTDVPCDRFTSAGGLEWELRRSPRAEGDLIRDSRLCSQRVFQFNLVLDGESRESASIWIRTVDGVLVSRISRLFVGEFGRMEGFAQPEDFFPQWETHLDEVARRRRDLGK